MDALKEIERLSRTSTLIGQQGSLGYALMVWQSTVARAVAKEFNSSILSPRILAKSEDYAVSLTLAGDPERYAGLYIEAILDKKALVVYTISGEVLAQYPFSQMLTMPVPRLAQEIYGDIGGKVNDLLRVTE